MSDKEILKEILLNRELPDLVINQETIDKIIGNPDAPPRQRLGRMRTTEEEYRYRDEILKRPLP